MRVLLRRYGFAVAYLAGVVAAGLAYTLLDPDAQARLIAWASTNVANLEHEPAGPLLVSAFVTSGFFAAWPVLIGRPSSARTVPSATPGQHWSAWPGT